MNRHDDNLPSRRFRDWLDNCLDDPENRVTVVCWVIACGLAAIIWLRFA